MRYTTGATVVYHVYVLHHRCYSSLPRICATLQVLQWSTTYMRYTTGATVIYHVFLCIVHHFSSTAFLCDTIWWRRTSCIRKGCPTAPLGSLQVLQCAECVPMTSNAALGHYWFDNATSATKEETNLCTTSSQQKESQREECLMFCSSIILVPPL